ncbi:hypothetical protein EDC01DRAFT_653737 [Geopyxis carbonaria]|nr:hypothetical protein EDC01DRAFT_653737 [Geopyxis carbonaria]
MPPDLFVGPGHSPTRLYKPLTYSSPHAPTSLCFPLRHLVFLLGLQRDFTVFLSFYYFTSPCCFHAKVFFLTKLGLLLLVLGGVCFFPHCFLSVCVGLGFFFCHGIQHSERVRTT